MAEENKRVKRRNKKNISSGIAHVNSTFNNTMITISDENGNIGGMMMWDGSFDILNVYSSVFEAGDVFEWLIWDSSMDLYYSANAVYDESYNNTDEFAVDVSKRASCGARTRGPEIKSLMLYRLS